MDMAVQVPNNLAIRSDNPSQLLWMGARAEPGRSASADSARVKLVAIQQVAHQRLRIIGLVQHICQDEDTGLAGKCGQLVAIRRHDMLVRCAHVQSHGENVFQRKGKGSFSGLRRDDLQRSI